MIIDQFAGVRNDVQSERFIAGDLATGLNITIDDTANIARRPGSTLTISANAHSLWSSPDDGICLYVDSGLLKQVFPDWSTTTLRSDLSNLPMSYAYCAGRVYYTNGVENGVIEDGSSRTFGLDVPPLFPASDTSGSLDSGQYIYTLCYVRNDGQEGGANAGTVVNVSNGGIAFTSIPVSSDPTVTHKMLYCTSANGDTLYEVELLDNSTTSYTLTSADFQVPSETVNFCAAPSGHLVAEYFGHLLIADGEVLYRSQTYGPELFDLTDYLVMPSRITMLAPTEDGIFIGTESELGYIMGTDPDSFSYSVKADYGIIEGTLSSVHTHRLNIPDMPETVAAMFLSTRGICFGLPGGTVSNITDTRYEITPSVRGASIVKQFGGSAAFITTT